MDFWLLSDVFYTKSLINNNNNNHAFSPPTPLLTPVLIHSLRWTGLYVTVLIDATGYTLVTINTMNTLICILGLNLRGCVCLSCLQLVVQSRIIEFKETDQLCTARVEGWKRKTIQGLTNHCPHTIQESNHRPSISLSHTDDQPWDAPCKRMRRHLTFSLHPDWTQCSCIFKLHKWLENELNLILSQSVILFEIFMLSR